MLSWFILAALGGALLFAVATHPIVTLSIIATLAVVTVAMERKRSQYVLDVSRERAGEDIGSFARAFDRRAGGPVDPWAIRAAWNALTPRTGAKGRRIPLRPTDYFEADLRIDPEDLEDLVPQLVEQCERIPGNWLANPYYDRLGTVADLVHFISAQPLRQSARAHLLPN